MLHAGDWKTAHSMASFWSLSPQLNSDCTEIAGREDDSDDTSPSGTQVAAAQEAGILQMLRDSKRSEIGREAENSFEWN